MTHAPLSPWVELEWPRVRVQARPPVQVRRLDCHGVHFAGTQDTHMTFARNKLLKNGRAQTYRRIIEQLMRLHFQRQ